MKIICKTHALLQVPSCSRLVERDLLLGLQALRQLIEPREACFHLLKGRVARGDAPTHVLQLLRLRREGGQLRRAKELLQLCCDLPRRAGI